ncbi:MAG: DUF4097 family beta strand repeat-containing protein [Bacteroidota bacterium]
MRFSSPPAPVRLAAALLFLAVALPPVAATPSSPAPPELTAAETTDVLFDESFVVREGGELRLDLGNEDVTVRTVRGTLARVVVEGRGRDAEREFERRRFSASSAGEDLIVRTDPPRSYWQNRPRTDASFSVTVEIPQRYSVDLDVGSGEIQLASIVGDARIDTGSGNVDVETIDGRAILIDTGSGNVRAERLRGEVRIDTGSGDVEVGSVEGGPLTIDTGSGDVDVALRTDASARFDTGSGDVTVRLARGAGFDVDMDGGRIRIDDVLQFAGRSERRSARGQIGRGGGKIQVGTGSGTIRLVAD